MTRRTGPQRVIDINRKAAAAKVERVAPRPTIADGAGPVPQAALDVLAKMLARGTAKRKGLAS